MCSVDQARNVRRSRKASIALFFAAIAASALACHDDEPKPTETVSSPSADLRALGIDAQGILPVVDPPRAAGDFLADVASFSTLEECMQTRSKMDPVLGEALDNIGYDTFVRDACRVLEAAKTKDRRRCTLIDSSTLKQRCMAAVAIVTKDETTCPGAAPGIERGLDPMCLAEALRSPAMCAAVEPRDRARCDAIVGKDDKACDKLLITEEHQTCVRDSLRWRSAMSDGAAVVASVAPVKATLEVHGDGRPDPAATSFDMGADVARGVVIVKDQKQTRFAIGELEDVLLPKAAAPTSRAKLALKVSFGADVTKSEVKDAMLSVPGAVMISCASSPCEWTAKVTKIEPVRGGAVELSLEGKVGSAPQAFRAKADVKTFVRDVVSAAP